MGKTILILAFVVLLGLILINRERVFVRDPVAAVYRNEVRQSGVQVFINYSNDVLLEQDYGEGATSRIMVQNWNQIPGTPAGLICIRWLACVTGDDHAPINPLANTAKRNYDPKVTMTNREVSFTDGDGSKLRIELR
jgi:hypothetical protein